MHAVVTTFGTSSAALGVNLSAPATAADGAVADYSRNIAAQLAVVNPNRHRDEADAVGHRVTEITLPREAA